jgi:hypothetical protein
MVDVHEKIGWRARWTISKFRDVSGVIAEKLREGCSVEAVKGLYPFSFITAETVDFNMALNEGLQELIDIICGLGSPTKWDNAHAYLGVGDSNTEAAASQTGLQAAVNKAFKAMDTGYPARVNQTVEWRATFGSGDANFSWQEYTVVNASSDTGKNLNRKTMDKGVKSSGETWTLSLQITFS